MRLGRATGTLMVVALAGVAATGCGFKGPLTVPESSEAVIIRAPAQAPGATSGETPVPTETAAPPSPATTTIRPKVDRPPPPPLPGSTQGG